MNPNQTARAGTEPERAVRLHMDRSVKPGKMLFQTDLPMIHLNIVLEELQLRRGERP